MDEMRRHGETERRPPVSMAARAAMGVIRVYQFTLSSIAGRSCRYAPTCSSYAAEAIERHGVWNGLWLGLFRVARCHPWGGAGYDPVPDVVGRHGLKIWRLIGDARKQKNRE